ncbi:hypothetical protein BKA64DRAFT_395530 [Cadophora sp. MPI-SDFR-AT-0126]|nr:hypothetical protein BKA64DRAFT_395530 [Leotiomycetes sp. MPI-SDFR-AT-0126]
MRLAVWLVGGRSHRAVLGGVITNCDWHRPILELETETKTNSTSLLYLQMMYVFLGVAVNCHVTEKHRHESMKSLRIILSSIPKKESALEAAAQVT